MDTVSKSNFGPLVAYLVPGVTALWGLQTYVPLVSTLFSPAEGASPTVGGFLYLTVASIAMGMTISAVRWAVVDTIHEWTGLRAPAFDFSRLGTKVAAYEFINHIHYQHYLFYANMTVAGAISYLGHRFTPATVSGFGWQDVAFVVIEAVFFFASRDTLRKYYERSARLLGVRR